MRAFQVSQSNADERLVAIIVPPMRRGEDFAEARAAVRRRIETKGNAYAECGLPLAVVCSSYNPFVKAEDLWHVACGTRLDQVVFVTVTGEAEPRTVYKPDGLWGFFTGQLKNRQTSYAVICPGLQVWNMGEVELWGALHPDPLHQWPQDALFADRNLLVEEDDEHYQVSWDRPP